MTPAHIHVTVVFATADVQDAVTVALPAGSTVADAVARSGLLHVHSLDPATLATAVHGQRCGPERRLRDGDRVELLRPLQAEPQEARRHRAARHRGARTR